MDPQTIIPTLPLKVTFWANQNDHMTNKVKFCDVHPELPWILSADKTTVYLWDFARRECLMEKTIVEIIELVDKKGRVPDKNSQPSFAGNRSFESTPISSPVFSQLAYKRDEPSESVIPASLRYLGEIKRVVFVDRIAMQWNCGGITIPPTSDTFHSNHRIMILCDGGIIFYDFFLGLTQVITPGDLGRVNICSAEFIFTDLCAIGGADGSIRIWDCLHWKLVKTLTTTSRGEISVLKNLIPKCRGPISQSSSGSDNSIREGRIRLLSIGLHSPLLASPCLAYDGSGLLWDTLVIGNIIQINEPTGHLLSQGSFAQHLDDTSNTLITVSADRTIRMWDLTSVKKAESGGSGKIRPGRRASITALSSSSAGSEHGRIPCVGKIKPGNALSPALSKFTHISHLDHPRYPFGTFVITSKSNSIGFVQIQEATAEEQSEKSSVRSASDTSLKLVSLHEITLSQLMAAYAAVIAANNSADQPQDNSIFNTKWLSTRDPSTKVYTVQAHPMYPEILIATTSVGVIVLTLNSPVSNGSGLSGFHHSWKNSGFLYSSDKRIQLCRINISGGLDMEDSSPRPTSTPRRGSILRTKQHSRTNSARMIPANTDDRDPYNPSAIVQLDVLEEILVIAESVGGVITQTSATPQNTLQKPASLRSNALLLACVTSRPIFRPSPSGKYCAVFWPESLYYVVLEMPAEIFGKNASRLGNKTKEVDRGQCYSLGWFTSERSETLEDQPSVFLQDFLILISPSKRIDATKKKKQTGFFKKKDNTPEGCLPPMILMKTFNEDGRVNETVCTGGPDDVDELHGGSFLVCISSLSKTNDSGASDEKKKKAVSQIELEAMQAQQLAEEKASGGNIVTKADDIPVHLTYKSQFYSLSVTSGTKSRQSNPSTLDESSVTSATSGENDFVLTPVGPVMELVTAVAWDTMRFISPTSSSVRQYLAVLIKSRVNILMLSSNKSSSVLTCVYSLELSSNSRTLPTSLMWRDGLLFVSTYQEILAIFPRPSDVQSMTADSAVLCSLKTPSLPTLHCPAQYRPFGWLEIGSVIDGYALLISRDCVLSPIPLASNPLASILLQLTKMVRSSIDKESLRNITRHIHLFPCSMREYLLGLVGFWLSNNLLLDEIETQFGEFRVVTLLDISLSMKGTVPESGLIDNLPSLESNHQAFIQEHGLNTGIQLITTNQIGGESLVLQSLLARTPFSSEISENYRLLYET